VTTYRMPEIRCVGCNSKLNHASDDIETSRPTPGDFTICLYCDQLMVFEDNLELRAPTDAERIEADQHEGVKESVDFARFYRKQRYGSEERRPREEG
jgi:hypothetical protein